MKNTDYGKKDILKRIYWDLHDRFKPVIKCDSLDTLLFAGDDMKMYVVVIMTLEEFADTKFPKKESLQK